MSSPTRPEFEEIVHTGGTVTALFADGGVALEIKHSNPTPATMMPVCVSFEDGSIRGFPQVKGIGHHHSDCPQGSAEVMLISDCEGMFGQRCPKCQGYFRSDSARSRNCPYCATRSHPAAYLTPTQHQFLINLMNLLIEALNEQASKTVNLNTLIKNSEENRHGWVYSEERQQTQHTCAECRMHFDILGEYAACPGCGFPNFRKIFDAKADALEAEFKQADENITDRHDREIEWGKLTRCISEFEALANKVKMLLLHLPATPSRRSSLNSLSFQNIVGTRAKLVSWFDIDIFKGVTEQDQDFLNKMFNRRHLFTHKGGQVDQEYLDNTADTSVRLHETIRFHSREIRRLIPLVRGCASHLLDGVESIG